MYYAWPQFSAGMKLVFSRIEIGIVHHFYWRLVPSSVADSYRTGGQNERYFFESTLLIFVRSSGGASMGLCVDIGTLFTGPLHAPYLVNRAEIFADAVREKKNANANCIGFINGTNIQIARPSNNGLQNMVYHEHKRFHVLTFQGFVCPDWIILHVYRPVEGPYAPLDHE